MGIIEEVKISLLYPHLYYKFKNESLPQIIRCQLIITLIGFVFINFKQFIVSFFSRGTIKYTDYYKGAGVSKFILNLFYMWVGIFIASFILSLIFLTLNYFKKIKFLTFGDIFNYSSHALIISAILGPFLGVFIIFFIAAYYVMALNGEKMKTKVEV
ncbi:MAG: hypothetical protein K0R54_3738 [Clostridiaceae bacterium]|jgi:hypothetical protein|nr:hypothetical protein [Clostridiaceae bacterium]